jgi:c-di-GMP-binding flagellar brake protein YcgR
MTDQGFNERRSSLRLDMEKQLISISWQNTSGKTSNRDVMCLDVSNGGLKISLETYIEAGTEVQVKFSQSDLPEQAYVANVIRCIQQPHGWFDVGLQFKK